MRVNLCMGVNVVTCLESGKELKKKIDQTNIILCRKIRLKKKSVSAQTDKIICWIISPYFFLLFLVLCLCFCSP